MEASQIKIGSKRSLIWGSSTQYRPYKLNMVSKRILCETFLLFPRKVLWSLQTIIRHLRSAGKLVKRGGGNGEGDALRICGGES